MTSTKLLTYVYKLIPSTAPPPYPLPDSLGLSSLDAKSGFIHLSTASQIPGTLKHFFASEPRVHVLRIKYARIEKDIKWEDPNAEGRQTCISSGIEYITTNQLATNHYQYAGRERVRACFLIYTMAVVLEKMKSRVWLSGRTMGQIGIQR